MKLVFCSIFIFCTITSYYYRSCLRLSLIVGFNSHSFPCWLKHIGKERRLTGRVYFTQIKNILNDRKWDWNTSYYHLAILSRLSVFYALTSSRFRQLAMCWLRIANRKTPFVTPSRMHGRSWYSSRRSTQVRTNGGLLPGTDLTSWHQFLYKHLPYCNVASTILHLATRCIYHTK